MELAKNKVMTREEIKDAILERYGSYGKIGKIAEFTRSYVFECLTGVKNGSLTFWNKILSLLPIEYDAEFKAFQLMRLVHPKEI